jgi:hypothetical protein
MIQVLGFVGERQAANFQTRLWDGAERKYGGCPKLTGQPPRSSRSSEGYPREAPSELSVHSITMPRGTLPSLNLLNGGKFSRSNGKTSRIASFTSPRGASLGGTTSHTAARTLELQLCNTLWRTPFSINCLSSPARPWRLGCRRFQGSFHGGRSGSPFVAAQGGPLSRRRYDVPSDCPARLALSWRAISFTQQSRKGLVVIVPAALAIFSSFL